MKKKFYAAVLIPVLLLGAIGYVNAITFGQPDGDEHPHVGTLLFARNGVGFFSCSGALISPTVMMTAGHCVEGDDGNVNDITFVRFRENALDGRENYILTRPWLDAEWIEATSVIPHPDYDGFAAYPQTFDVGLVILSEPVYVDTYGTLPPKGFLETVLDDNGNSTNWWTAVGYGRQGVLNPFAMRDYARYNSITRLIEMNSTDNGQESSAKFSNNPGKGRGGTCFGDSGGPIFYQDTNIIGAVVSFGYTPCIGLEYHFRIDTATALDFINAN